MSNVKKFWSRLALALSIKGLEGEGFQRERVALGYNVFPVVSKKAFPRSLVPSEVAASSLVSNVRLAPRRSLMYVHFLVVRT